MVVSTFKNLYEKSPRYCDVNVVFEAIRTGASQRALIEQIRSTVSKEERDELKKELGVVLFSGKFKFRKASELLEYSKLVCLEFDKLDNPEATKQTLIKNSFVYACWLSPSGNGLRLLVKVSSENHLGHFLALLKEFPGADVSTKDVCRAMFHSYDPEIYINPDSQIYTKILESVYTNEQKYSKLKIWLENKGDKFVNGNRNNFIAKLSGAMNRFGIPMNVAEQYLTKDYVKSDFSFREMQNTVNKIYNNYQEQHNTASFDDSFSELEVSAILSSEIKVQDIITLADVENDLYQDYDVGMKGGDTTHFPELDEHFRWMRGELTTLTGVANSGKSSMLAQLLTFRAAFNKEKFALLSMEQYPPVFFYRELIRTIVGKPLERNSPARMSRLEYERAMEWVKSHFFFIYPEKDDATPEWTIARFTEAIIKYGVDGCVVDPHNSQAHDYKNSGGRDDRYLANILNKDQRFALAQSIYYIRVAHPRGIGKKDDGTYKEPTADEISGGPTFWQRCDNILVFHRPQLPLDFQDPTCTLRSVKIKKQSLNGIPGVANFTYDRRSGRYYENGYNPLEDFKL